MAFPQSPDPSHISALVAIIVNGVSGGAQGANHAYAAQSQSQVIQQLEAFFVAHTDYPWYLGWILCMGCDTGSGVVTDASMGMSVRMSAGLLLKNELRRRFSDEANGTGMMDTRWLPSLAELVLGVGLCLEEKALRHTASTVVSSLVCASGTRADFPATPYIVDTLTNSFLSVRQVGDVGLEGALDALVKMWEDCPLAVLAGERAEEEEGDGGAVDARRAAGQSGETVRIARWSGVWQHVLRLLEQVAAAQHVQPSQDEFSKRCIQTQVLLIKVLNYALYNQSGFLDVVGVLERYIASLFALATHPDPSIRRVVCVGLNHVTELAPSKISASNSLPSLIEYMIAATEDTENEQVALEASEFWTVFAEAGFDGAILRPFVPRIVPLLLKNMRFDEWDEAVEEAEAVEEQAGGQDELGEVLRPHVGGAKKGQNAGVGNDKDDENEYDADDDDADTTWNLRKSAAAGLDMISTFLGDDILPILLPAVQTCLNNTEDWRVREAAILALGAVSQGCHSGLAQYLDAILAAALPGLVDPRPMLRVISCWTLTRYSRQIIMRAKEGDSRGLDAVLAGIVDRLLHDRNWVVQVSACGSMSTLVEEEPSFVLRAAVGNADKICGAFTFGLQGYGRRGLRALYDAVSVMLLCAPGELMSGCSQYTQMIEALFAKLDTFADGDPEILPYLDCLSNAGMSYSSAPSPGPAPHGGTVDQTQYAFVRLMETAFFKLDAIVERYFIAMDSGALDPDEAIRFLEHLLDAIDGMTLGLSAATAAVAGCPPHAASAATQPDILGGVFSRTALGTHIVRAAQSNSNQLRQSAFGLLGDLMGTNSLPNGTAATSSMTAHLLPYLSPLVEAALATIHPEHITPNAVDACNNAAWSLGVVAKACSGADVAQFALVALERLAPILTAPMATVPRSLVENAAICLGRLALVTPETLAPHAHVYMGGWCAALRGLTDGEEKADAFKGLLRVVQANPAIAQTYFKSLCECFASWQREGPHHGPGCDAWGQTLSGDMQQVLTLGVQSGYDLNVLHPNVRGKLGI